MNLRLLVPAILLAILPAAFAADSDLSKLAAANNTFAFKLLKQLSSENKDGNIFISPYSAATALQMAANGAAGQTRTEMQLALETIGLSTTALNEASKAAAAALSSTDTNLSLTTANALVVPPDRADQARLSRRKPKILLLHDQGPGFR